MARRLRPEPPVTLPDRIARLPAWAWGVAALSLAAAVAFGAGGGNLALAVAALVALPLAGAAVVSARVQAKREERARAEAAASGEDILKGMGWREFEVLISESFRLRGYRVVELIGGGEEHSFDIVLSRQQRTYLAHCRPLIGDRLDVEVVRGLDARRAVRGAAGGMVVSGARFTREAVQFAKERQVTLISGSALRSLISQARTLRQSAVNSPRATPADTPGADRAKVARNG